jgi:hypothetical protein
MMRELCEQLCELLILMDAPIHCADTRPDIVWHDPKLDGFEEHSVSPPHLTASGDDDWSAYVRIPYRRAYR